jgi:CheY-like chemotaxis protein
MPPQILVCDDDISIRDIVKIALQRRGFEVVEASNGLEAVKACRAGPAACIIMDIDMPVMNGIEATRIILKEKPDTVIIGLTAYRQLGKELLSAGARYVIEKPFSVRNLISIVEKYANLKNA